GVGNVEWGSHVCTFFSSPREIVEVLLPYFLAGLSNNERCLWIVSPPLSVGDALEALEREGVRPQDDAWRARISVHEFATWYADPASTRPDTGMRRWGAEEKRTLADGFAGLRIAGQVPRLEGARRETFMAYEAAASRAFRGCRSIALCAYSLRASGTDDIFEVIHAHPFTLDRRDGGWEIVERGTPPARR
ncbi:MAG TPA: MEDS domain-containing protein, partial [Planctomycetota bacterium]|nr:MEDS domain-containing protein [Planctomycetota bacterium]